MAKKYCDYCGHRCHCEGQGFYVDMDQCDSCNCSNCMCEPLVLDKVKKKSWWQRYVDWLFN